MASSIIEKERIVHRRSGEPDDGDVVVYWMQQAQRASGNDALEHAIRCSNDLGLPLAVVFCAYGDHPDASARHYHFMLEGLRDVRSMLRRRSIAFTVFASDAPSALRAIDDRMALLVMDRGYLPIQQSMRSDVVEATTCPIVEVETDVVVPIDIVSDQLESAARTIRPKITAELDRFVVERSTTAVEVASSAGSKHAVDLGRSTNAPPTVDLDDLSSAMDLIGVDRAVAPVEGWTGGTSQARARLRHFCTQVLPEYEERRNRYDQSDSCSTLSPYLHFGQISPVEVVRLVRASEAPASDIDAFIDELVIRRELAINFVVHESEHGSFGGLPEWAQDTLDAHGDDTRPARFTASELEAGETDDEIWNAIMGVIRSEGWVHNQLRMYWGKQILYWTNTPEHAFRTLLDLNNRYFLDGRDANSYANVAWCFGRHDQGFQERPVIGKIRPFTDQALRRKGDLDGWLDAHR